MWHAGDTCTAAEHEHAYHEAYSTAAAAAASEHSPQELWHDVQEDFAEDEDAVPGLGSGQYTDVEAAAAVLERAQVFYNDLLMADYTEDEARGHVLNEYGVSYGLVGRGSSSTATVTELGATKQLLAAAEQVLSSMPARAARHWQPISAVCGGLQAGQCAGASHCLLVCVNFLHRLQRCSM